MTGSLEERFQNLHEFVTQARTNREFAEKLLATLADDPAALHRGGFLTGFELRAMRVYESR